MGLDDQPKCQIEGSTGGRVPLIAIRTRSLRRLARMRFRNRKLLDGDGAICECAASWCCSALRAVRSEERVYICVRALSLFVLACLSACVSQWVILTSQHPHV